MAINSRSKSAILKLKQDAPEIGIISTFPPTQCGIATYAHDLVQALKLTSPSLHFTKLELTNSSCNNIGKNYGIRNGETAEYLKAAQYINSSNIGIVDIQHEYKIFGKPDGENILVLLRHITKPVVTTLHTVSTNLNELREKLFQETVQRSDLLYVFSSEAKEFIVNRYNKSGDAIEIIPHGVPSIQFKNRSQIKGKEKYPDKLIFVSAGHMRNTKGYELAITALHALRKEIPDFHYLILGSNHPENETAKSYREMLEKLISRLNFSGSVSFISNYMEERELIRYIQLADVCLLPYTRGDQSSSGVLALMMACGRPVVSTPFQFAKSYVNELSGIMSSSFCHAGFEQAIREIINKKSFWDRMSLYNHSLGKAWNWKKVAHQYSSGYRKIIENNSPILFTKNQKDS